MLAAASLVALAITGYAATTEVDVSPGNLNGWSSTSSGTGAFSFVNGPGTPPCDTGSAQFTVPDGTSAAQLTTTAYNGTLLSDLTALSYSTYVQSSGGSQQAPYLILDIDTTGDGVADDTLIFEPAYQDSAHFPSNPQSAIANGTWQTWDALNGGWYSTNGTGGTSPGTVKSLADYQAALPSGTTAKIVGIHITAGLPSATGWSSFTGNVDCFTIGVSGGDTKTYDFELDADNDGVPDDQDQCLDSDMRPKVDVNGSQSGVTSIQNSTNTQGCTIQDQVNQCADGATNHGQYVSCVTQLANQLYNDGTISKSQRQEMKTGAAQSDIGKDDHGSNNNGHGHGKGKGKGHGHGHGGH